MINMQKIKKRIKRVKFLLNRENKYIPSGYKNSKNICDSMPKVSILLPIYNHAKVAKYAISSILNQTYKNIELIILDDGSTDNLQEELKQYYIYDNVKIYFQKNQKLPRALTHLHELATGEFITWTSADNIMHPKMIEVLVKELMLNPKAALVYGDVYLIDKNNRPYYGICRDIERDYKHARIVRLNRSDKPLSIGNDNYINASFLYRKENSEAIMGKYADDIIGAEDYDFWLRLQKTGKLVHINSKSPLYYYRVHDNSMSHELETKKAKEHQSRLQNLQMYEQNRIGWCTKRTNIIIDTEENSQEIEANLLQLAVYINKKDYDKNLYFTNKLCKNDIYYKMGKEYYTLINGTENKEITKIFIGIDMPREAYRARNLFSHSFYQEDLMKIKNPIFGCHINSSLSDIEEIEKVLKNNSTTTFVILDEIENGKLLEMAQKFENFIYYPNKEYGKEYQTYSYFARFISFKNESDLNKYKTLLLSYATGRRINYNIDEEFYYQFPYTIAYNNEIEFYENDGINDFDYQNMDNYLQEYSKVGTLNKCINFFNGYTQEMFIQRPKYNVGEIPKESKPMQIK